VKRFLAACQAERMSPQRRRTKTIFRSVLGVLMVLAGLTHFVMPESYEMIVPDYLPWHLALVYISGVIEIALGIAVFIEPVRALAGWGLIALYIAVLPANVWMASEGIQPPGMEMSTPVAWVRVAMQFVLIYWAWAVTRPDTPERPA
jgi:uncharacterized membrane protein